MTKTVINKEAIEELLNSRYIEAIFPSKERVREMFSSGKQLTFYWGIDPTGPDVHLGHSTNLLFIKSLIKLGHKMILLVGDFTAKIGDPSGKDTARKPLTDEEVKENMKTYLRQVQMILPEGSFEVKYNSSWLKKMSFEDVVKLASHFTVQQMIVREMFQRRLKEQKPIALHEFLYPLMQGYDSVAMEVDGEIGGNDQTFNMLTGRDLVKNLLDKEKIVIATKLLEDPVTGKKLMSKSEGHYISLNDTPENMFGKVMSMADTAIVPLFTYTTEVSNEKINEIKERLEKNENPKDVKEELAAELVRMYFGEEEATKAKENFKNVFSKGKLPENIQEVPSDGQTILQTMTIAGIVSSNSEAKRLVSDGAVTVNGEKIKDWEHINKEGDDVKVGPRKFLKITKGK
jgi:tyrosyl-tRNA synthetase